MGTQIRTHNNYNLITTDNVQRARGIRIRTFSNAFAHRLFGIILSSRFPLHVLSKTVADCAV